MLSARQVEEFFEVGFVVRPGLFSPGEVARMRRAFDRVERIAEGLGESRMYGGSQFVLGRRAGGRGVRIDRVVWCGAVERELSRWGKDPRLLRIAAQLLGSREMNQLINQAHFKLPGDGVEFPWHQDSRHRRYGRGEWIDANGRGSYVQTVVTIDDMTCDNGPLEFIPGSCKLGHVETAGEAEGELPRDRVDPREAVTLTMKAGSVLFFGPYVFHRSLPNRSSRPRRVFINGFAYPGANSRDYPGEGAGRLLRAS